MGGEGERRQGVRVPARGLPFPQVSCLCGSAPCILCGCCPSSPNSTVTRLIFTAFLLLGVLVSIIMLSPGVESQLHKVRGPGAGRGVGQPAGPGLKRRRASCSGRGGGLRSQLIQKAGAPTLQGW